MSRILLGASASVSVYKACDLASKLAQAGHEVRAVLTPRAAELVSPQLFEAVTGQPARVDEFSGEREGAMDHIDLARWAELCCIAPLTADLAGRIANGLAGDLLSTAVLALGAETRRLCAPAMNPSMLANPAVRRNLATLEDDGWRVLQPGVGHMACGEDGSGRLPEPVEIVAAIEEMLAG